MLTNIQSKKEFTEKDLSKFSPKVLLKNKPLANIFIRFFIDTYYGANSSENQKKEGQNMLEILASNIKSNSNGKGRNRMKIMSYIYAEILSFDMIANAYDSFENMNLYSTIFDVFQNSNLKIEDQNSVSSQAPHRQINFFLQVYAKS